MFKNLIFKIRRKYIDYKLNKYFGTGKLLLTNDKHRQIGKTTMLLKLVNKKHLYIFTNSQREADRLNKLYYTQFKNIFEKSYDKCKNNVLPIAYSCSNIDNLRGVRFPNGVLLDEGIDIEKVYKIKNIGIEIKTGFYYNPMLT